MNAAGGINLKQVLIIALIIYLIVVNCVAYYMMYSDKQKAINRQWRIPEASLFLSAILGGSIGAILGMRTFRHKTKHWYFVYGMPFILICQVVLGVFLVMKFR